MAHRLTLDPLPIETKQVVFDITRLYRNRLSPFGTGVDRIDLAIGREFSRRFGERCRFVHVCWGGFAEAPRAAAEALMDALDQRWHAGAAVGGPDLWPALARGRLRSAMGARIGGEDATYVVASHSGLPQREGYLRRFDPDLVMRRLVYIHDLIPLEYPEYQTPRSRLIFRRYLDEIADAPVRFAVNSVDTSERLAAYTEAKGWSIEPPVVAIPRLEGGGAPPPLEADLQRLFDAGPVFVALGTIEPRKNHLLLLNAWRAMAEEGDAPTLLIIGKRGWMNEAAVAMLDHCETIRPHVVERGDLDDGQIAAALAAARAMLFPSFAEGLGLPMLEAAAAGAPVIASDLPALREIAAPDTTFLDPTDGPGWRRAIRAAASP